MEKRICARNTQTQTQMQISSVAAPEYTSFDSVETYAVKLAYVWDLPLRSVAVIDNLSFAPKFLNVERFIRDRLPKPVPNNIGSGLGIVGKSLVLIDRELTKVVQKNVSDIIVGVAAAEFVEFLADKVTDIFTAATYPAVYQREIEARLDVINAYPVAVQMNSNQRVTFESLRALYVVNRNTYAKQREEIVRIFNEILEVQAVYAQAMSTGMLQISDLIIITEKIQLLISDDKSEQDVIPLFDDAIPTPAIRHIICQTATEMYQKKYKPGPFERLLEQKWIDPSTVTQTNVIVFSVFANSLYRFTYYVDEGYIEGSVKHTDKALVINEIRKFLPLRMTERTDEYTCQVRLYPVHAKTFSISLQYLLHRIVIQPQYFPFYLNESTSPFALKTQPKLKFREYFNRGAGYIKSRGRKDEGVFILSAPKLLSGSNYLSIDIVKTFSLASVYRMMTFIVPAIALYYATDIVNGSPLTGIYNFPPNLLPATVAAPTKSARGIAASGKTKNLSKKDIEAQLNDEWPTVFTKNYLGSVDALKDLVITTTNPLDAEVWRTEIIIKGKDQYTRMVGEFPPNTPDGVLFWFTSVSSDAPYIGFTLNKADERPLYPWVPRSFVSPSGERDMNSSGKGEAATSLMALTEGNKLGVAPEVLDVVVGRRVIRHAVPKGPDALIKAVLLAMGNTSGVDAVRQQMLSLPFEIYLQQVYDLSREEFVAKLSDPLEYLDPALYVVGLEYIFNIDIHVLMPHTHGNLTQHTVELPRHKEFYCRTGKVRPCIIIYKNPGMKSDELQHPHCELIVDDDTGGKIFDQATSTRLRNISTQTNSYIHVLDKDLFYRSQCMDSMLYKILEQPGTSLVGQIIDGYGKARAVTLDISGGNGAVVRATLFCFPSAPFACSEDSVVYPTTMEWITSFCGNNKPTGRSNVGVWITHAESGEILYARLVETSTNTNLFLSLPITNQDPLALPSGGDLSNGALGDDYIPICVAKDRMAAILRESLKWLFEIYVALGHSKRNVKAEEFISRVLTHRDGDGVDENTYYAISLSDTRVFPSVDSINEAYSYVREFVIPHVDADGRFVLHSLKYFQSISYVLQRHANTMIIGPETTDRRYIKGIYNSLHDFKQHPNTIVIVGKHSTDTTNTAGNAPGPTSDAFVVVSELENAQLGSADPIMYHNTTGSGREDYLLIQATYAATVASAYSVCDAWATSHVNIGYNAPSAERMSIPVIVYTLDMNVLSPALYLVDGVAAPLPNNAGISNGDQFYEMIINDYKYYAALRV